MTMTITVIITATKRTAFMLPVTVMTQLLQTLTADSEDESLLLQQALQVNANTTHGL